MSTKFRPNARCPRLGCGRYPAIRFAEEEVRRARTMRQGQNVQEVTCGCGQRYWLQARAIAEATPNGNGSTWPAGFPESAVGALATANISSMADLEKVADWTSIPGIGPATERKMRLAMQGT